MTSDSWKTKTAVAWSATLALLVLGAASRSRALEPSAGGEAAYVIGVGETLQVAVWKNPELSVTVPVRPDGKVSLPLVGEVEAAGKTPEDLRREVTGLFAEYVTSPAVSVVVEEINSREVFILGEVATAGAYPILRPTRLMQLLARAGGWTEFAKKDEIILLREGENGQERRVLSIKNVQSGRGLEDNIWLRPGDTVVVP